MNSAIYDNIFARANAGQRNFVEVPMNHARIVLLFENEAGAIATRRLGGCSGVVVLGRTAAIMAHIAPLPSRRVTPRQGVSESERHFMDILRRAESLYVNNRARFPPESTAWGFYLANAEIVTNDLRVIVSRRFAALGLPSQHAYYEAYRSADRRDQVRIAVQLDGLGTTSFNVESAQIESVRFSEPLPDQHASQSTEQPQQSNFLTFAARDQRFVQMFFGRAIMPDLHRLTGVYDVLSVQSDGRPVWRKYNFDSRTWV